MRILISPDKFKGSLTAQQVCEAVRDGLLAADAELEVVMLPLADGGEGMSALLTAFSGGTAVKVSVRDPLFRPVDAVYGISKDGSTAFIEMAAASGLMLLQPAERNPMLTSSIGTGDLIRDALDRGIKQIVLGIGGSATNDGGMGVMSVLGAKFFDAGGKELLPVGASLLQVHTVDATALHPGLHEVAIKILCDVGNPLYGPLGAAFVFAPQKGADEDMVRELDAGLRNFGDVLHWQFDKPMNFVGAGAAGGLGASLVAMANARTLDGVGFITEFMGLKDQVRQADLVITGEGKIDTQTLSGKVVKGVAALAKSWNKPVVAVAGKCELTEDQIKGLFIDKVVVLVDGKTPEPEAMTRGFDLLKERISKAWISMGADKKS
jgi:glycerate 2-kinase